ncbi:MAG: glycosyltransferase [Candidatus Brocadiaceae bacterium]|nr:glycosyltransferase [Candidatus Brocadiaceae bacterium]
MPHRVLYVNGSCRLYGAEGSLLQLLGGLDRGRWEPLAAVPAAGPLARALERARVPVVRVPMPLLRRRPHPAALAWTAGRVAAAAVAIARYVRRRGVSLVHVNTMGAMPAAGLAAALAGVPCVWHLRDLRGVRRAVHVCAGLADAVIAVSRAVAREAALPAGARPAMHVIHNAIDADAFARQARPGRTRAELGVAEGDPLVAFVAQMAPWKGYERLFRALCILRERRLPLTAAVAGDASLARNAAYGLRLHALAADLGLEGTVRFLGFRTDVASLLADADVLAVASEAEPFGRVVLEAMAVGTPVVATGFGGVAEVVEDGRTGVLVRDLSAESLADALERVLSDDRARAAMGRAGARRVRADFGLAEHVRRVCGVYDEVLRARSLACPAPDRYKGEW